MAVTSIWRVHGRVGKVLDYVENAEKTTAVSSGDGDLSDVIDYAIQQRKTSQTQVRDGEEVVQRFVSGINCHPSTAGMEMQKVKKFYGKEDGVIAYQLYRKADFEHGGRLPVHVHFVMDEFANVALPDDFDKLLATMRSREISVSIILQNLAQLKALFDKQWESIVGNCDTFLYLGGNEQSTHEYVSKLLGKQTIDTNTYGQSKGRSGSYTTNFQTAGRELMTPDEVRMLDNRYALLFIRGERPVKDLKYNILKHPNVALTTDGKAVAYQHGTDPLSVAAVSINLEKLKQAIPEDTDTGDYAVLTEEEVYDFMRKKAQENNQNQNSNYQEVTYVHSHCPHSAVHFCRRTHPEHWQELSQKLRFRLPGRSRHCSGLRDFLRLCILAPCGGCGSGSCYDGVELYWRADLQYADPRWFREDGG